MKNLFTALWKPRILTVSWNTREDGSLPLIQGHKPKFKGLDIKRQEKMSMVAK